MVAWCRVLLMLKNYKIATIFVVFSTSLSSAEKMYDFYSCPSIESGKYAP